MLPYKCSTTIPACTMCFRIQVMMQSDDDIFSIEAEDEFTRLQAFIVELLEKHYAYWAAFYGRFQSLLKRFEGAKA
jgi:hypothetical protein